MTPCVTVLIVVRGETEAVLMNLRSDACGVVERVLRSELWKLQLEAEIEGLKLAAVEDEDFNPRFFELVISRF